jgi:xylulokinase
MVSDKRALSQVDYLKEQKYFGNEDIGISTSYTIPKILWFKDFDPVFKDIKYWLGAGEFLNYVFTEEIFTDTLNASKSFYKDNEGYPSDLFKSIGIEEESFPTVEPIGTKYDLAASIKKKYGFNDNCKFILTTYDAVCAVLGSGNSLDNNACDVSGTVTSVRMLINEEDLNPDYKSSSPFLLVQKIDLINKIVIGASNNMGGGLIEWLKQAFYDENDMDVYFRMENDAIKSSIGSNGIVFLPYLLGERAPFVSNNIRAEFIGINRSCKQKDFSRAVFETAAFVTNDLLSVIKDYNPTSLSVSGGLARFDLINQIKADVTGLPVHVVENFESTSLGALLLCILANDSSLNYSEVSDRILKVRKIINPNEKNNKIYKEYYRFFVDHREVVIDSYENHSLLYKMLDSYASKNIRNL